jgi:hypothetical protein
MESDKKHGGRWLLIGLLAFLIAYPLSYGPVEWLLERMVLPMWLETGIDYFYSPLNYALYNVVPFWAFKAFVGYVRWWAPDWP